MKPHKLLCTLEEHHASNAIGSTLLKVLIQKSPAHYLYKKEHREEPTPVQKFGNAIHQAVLEPALFAEKIVVEPVFAGTGSKLARETWHLQNHGKTIVKAEQMESIQGIWRSLSKHKQASKLISDGHAEESLMWADKESGIACKARPDYLREGHILVDVKSTIDASYASFKKDIANYLYHVQAALYLDGATEVYGQEFDQFVIIACEKEAPYGINCFSLGMETIDEGRALYMQGLKTLKKCVDSGKYPNYPDDEILTIGLPTWAYKSEGL